MRHACTSLPFRRPCGRLLLFAAPASASHSHPATYTGGVSGGSLEFDVSADGTSITRLRIIAVSECARHDLELTTRIAIVDHAFDYTSSGLWFSGTVPGSGGGGGRAALPPGLPGLHELGTRLDRETARRPLSPRTRPRRSSTLSGPATQRAGRTVTVTVTSNEAGAARATGRVRGRFALAASAAMLTAHAPARLSLRVPSRARRAVARALRDGRRVRAVVTVSVRDAAGNRTDRSRTIRLRRR